MTIFYLGQFPPPFGGVTVKNALLLDELSKHVPIKAVSFHDDSFIEILKTVLLSNDDELLIIGFGNKDLRRRFVKILAKIRPKTLERVVLIGMGGRLGKELMHDRKYAESCSAMSAVCLETEGMVLEAQQAGLKNAVLLPNCRPRPKTLPEEDREGKRGSLKALFFSRIEEGKGVDVVLEAARCTPSVEYSFYGPVKESNRDFLERLEDIPNVSYCGLMDGSSADFLEELGKFDIHLFPSRYDTEGVPGVLVETKIAGVPSIVSNTSYNAELIEDGVSGIVVDDFEVDSWANAINCIDADRAFLRELKRGASESASKYFSDVCIEPILEIINKSKVMQ